MFESLLIFLYFSDLFFLVKGDFIIPDSSPI